jgi:adenylate cyclase class 2
MNKDIEYEGKILDVDIKDATKRIEGAGGVFAKKLEFRRYVFDVIPAKKGTWLRLRTDGVDTTITIKEIKHDGVDGTFEYETTVGDFDAMLKVLHKSGFNENGYQENKRTLYKIGDVEVSIDEWPKIPPYIEVEGPDKATVEKTVKLLGYDVDKLTGENTEKIYTKYGIDLKQIEKLKF